jgi:hypothetical protein
MMLLLIKVRSEMQKVVSVRRLEVRKLKVEEGIEEMKVRLISFIVAPS